MNVANAVLPILFVPILLAIVSSAIIIVLSEPYCSWM